MGFPSPAQDYIEKSISLDELCISKPHATYFMKAGRNAPTVAIVEGALLVVDSSMTPSDGAVVCAIEEGELVLRRYVKRPVHGLAELEPPCRFTAITSEEEKRNEDQTVWGVVNWWLTPASASDLICVRV
ncbi:S24 family peptidase [Erwinia mallotivora]|uniref:S24 family peptidase n=1 Tax=Erwinia mallotivora TaxID=69222 RepID=UPI0021C21A8D|nr:S24 family peptidase [Erwinia mallotivora]